jgi:hypothetical protein
MGNLEVPRNPHSELISVRILDRPPRRVPEKIVIEVGPAAIKRRVRKLSARRYGEGSPAKDARIDRISTWSQHRQYRAVQGGNRQAEAALAMVYQEDGELNQAAYDRAVGGEKTEAQKGPNEEKNCHDPERSRLCPRHRSIDDKRYGYGNPENEQRSSCRSRGKHGEQSLHTCRLSGGRLRGNLERRGARPSFRGL